MCACVCQIHLSFSLEMSGSDEEARKVTERNVVLRMILNTLTSFATIIGKTKDAELRYVYVYSDFVFLSFKFSTIQFH